MHNTKKADITHNARSAFNIQHSTLFSFYSTSPSLMMCLPFYTHSPMVAIWLATTRFFSLSIELCSSSMLCASAREVLSLYRAFSRTSACLQGRNIWFEVLKALLFFTMRSKSSKSIVIPMPVPSVLLLLLLLLLSLFSSS